MSLPSQRKMCMRPIKRKKQPLFDYFVASGQMEWNNHDDNNNQQQRFNHHKEQKRKLLQSISVVIVQSCVPTHEGKTRTTTIIFLLSSVKFEVWTLMRTPLKQDENKVDSCQQEGMLKREQGNINNTSLVLFLNTHRAPFISSKIFNTLCYGKEKVKEDMCNYIDVYTQQRQ